MGKNSTKEKLAIFGGEPVRRNPWPVWPRADENTEKMLIDVLHSGRWTISGCYTGKKPYERQFAEAFAEFHNVPYCVPTANGSAALKIALEALGVGYGKEVLVPGLTWIACASSVLATGAVPVFVDIDPESLCMSLEEVQKAITRNTAAIMLVHLYCRIADLEGFMRLSEEMGIPIIEDCSQAHGAIWKGQRVGTFGKIGVFSMQQTKVLTCGEGGATITTDNDLFEKMQQLRADGRLYSNKPGVVGQMELEEMDIVQGRNYCMSEFHAAVLLDRLQHLDEENRIRAENAVLLNSHLRDDTDFIPLIPSIETEMPSYYQYCIRVNLRAFNDNTIDVIAEALTSELGIMVKPTYSSLMRYTSQQERISHNNYSTIGLPVTETIRNNAIVIPHHVLLGTDKDVLDIYNALIKVKQNI